MRTTLDQHSPETISIELSVSEATWFSNIFSLMMDLPSLNDYKPCSHQEVEQTLLKAFISQALLTYAQREQQVSYHHASRSFSLNKKFRQLLHHNYKTLKRPSDYAGLLNVSVSYLNGTIKLATGFSVSQLIRKEIIWEAQRLLYYTDLSIKEIGLLLGYEDQKYFNRLFKKASLLTPGEFRKNSTVFQKD